MLPMVKAEFSNGAPPLRDVVAEAERLGGLSIKIVSGDPLDRRLYLAFDAFPQARVDISRDPSSVWVSDIGRAPALYRLLRKTLIQLGGTDDHGEIKLALPLTEAYVKKLARQESLAAVLVILWVLAMYSAVIGAIGWFIWG